MSEEKSGKWVFNGYSTEPPEGRQSQLMQAGISIAYSSDSVVTGCTFAPSPEVRLIRAADAVASGDTSWGAIDELRAASEALKRSRLFGIFWAAETQKAAGTATKDSAG